MKTVLFGLLSIAYPVGIWLAGKSIEPKFMALSLVLIAAVRLVASREKIWLAVAIGSLALAATASVLNESWPLRLYPVLVNASLLLLFGASILYPPSIVERLARLRDPLLSTTAIAYTRKVTIVWCLFFFFNGVVSAASAVFGSDTQWAFYNGFLSYVLMGLIAAVEFVIRRQVKAATKTGTPLNG